MLKVTSKAISVLKATAKSKAGMSDDAGIRIRRDAGSREDGTIRVGLDVCDRPEPGDAELEEDGLHIFVEDALKEPAGGSDARRSERRRKSKIYFHLALSEHLSRDGSDDE